MKKAKSITLIVALIAIVGIIFVSASFTPKESASEEKIEAGTTCGTPTCGTENCNFECGGDCGIPKCGCGR